MIGDTVVRGHDNRADDRRQYQSHGFEYQKNEALICMEAAIFRLGTGHKGNEEEKAEISQPCDSFVFLNILFRGSILRLLRRLLILLVLLLGRLLILLIILLRLLGRLELIAALRAESDAILNLCTTL